MTSVYKLLSEAQIHRINDAVAAASQHTAAKIVPVVTSCSGRYERAEELIGWWAAALGLALTGVLVTGPMVVAERTETGPARWALNLGMVLGIIVVGSLAGAMLSTQIGWLRRLFIPKRTMRQAVRDRAQHVLRDTRIRCGDEGSDRPIVLIFVSLYERLVEVAADEPIAPTLTPAAVEPIRSVILEGIATGRACWAICQAVAMTAELIAPICPPKSGRLERSQEVLRVIE